MGIGCDVVNIFRIEKLLKKYNQDFINRILSNEEQKRYNNLADDIKIKSSYLAKRFAGKEAVSKALGEGIGNISFNEISIINREDGSPYVRILNEKCSIKNDQIQISLSDDWQVAIAFVVISV